MQKSNSCTSINLDTKINTYDQFQQLLDQTINRIPSQLRGTYEALKVGNITPVNFYIGNYDLTFDSDVINDLTINGLDILFTTSSSKSYKLTRDENNSLVLLELDSDQVTVKQNGEKYVLTIPNFDSDKQTLINKLTNFDKSKFSNEIIYDKNSGKTDQQILSGLIESKKLLINQATSQYDLQLIEDDFNDETIKIATAEVDKFIEEALLNYDNTNTGKFGIQSKFGPNQTDREKVSEQISWIYNGIQTAKLAADVFDALDSIKNTLNNLDQYDGIKTITEKEKYVKDELDKLKAITFDNIETELNISIGLTDSDKAKVLEMITACIQQVESETTLGAKYYYLNNYKEIDWLDDWTSIDSIINIISENILKGNFTATNSSGSNTLTLQIDEYSISITDSSSNTTIIKGTDSIIFVQVDSNNSYIEFEYNSKTYRFYYNNSGSYELVEYDAFGNPIKNGDNYTASINI